MNSTLCRTLRKLLADGFEQYNGIIDPAVYERLECPDPKKAYWVCSWPILHCLGCRKRCTPKDISGFQVTLPMPEELTYEGLTAPQLLKKKLLRVDEAAFCLNISHSLVRKWAKCGKLDATINKPVRVTSESVAKELENIDV
ncbi:DNA-binding protein [Maridesulfovibrio sp.]|uniref:DNA-binding protein n=1 Tax=Maridesulfovibrio sp. TaxID=2795000 RepID=UPI0039EE263C